MKKLISLFLVSTIMVFTMLTPVSAVSKNNNGTWNENGNEIVNDYSAIEKLNVEIKEELGFTVHEIKLPTISQIVDETAEIMSTDALDRYIAKQGDENVQTIKQYICTLDLSEQEKAIQLKEIDEVIADGYVDGYKIYIASANNVDYTYYGVYSGMSFYQRPSSEISVNYKKETERNLSKLNKWISMAVDLVLSIDECAPLSLAITAFKVGDVMYGDNYKARSGDYTEYYVRTVRRVREIGIINDWNDFRTVMADNKVDMYPYSIYHFADPSIYNCSATVTEYIEEWRTVYSKYYNNYSYNLKAAYEQYTQRPDLILYMEGAKVDSSMFVWEWK